MMKLKNKTRIKRRYFLIFEVVIAMLLIVMIAVPLLQPSISMLLQERRSIEELSLEKELSQSYVELMLALHENEIPWDTLSDYNWHEFDKTSFKQTAVQYRFLKKYKKENERQNGSHFLKFMEIEVKNRNQKKNRVYTVFLTHQQVKNEDET